MLTKQSGILTHCRAASLVNAISRFSIDEAHAAVLAEALKVGAPAATRRHSLVPARPAAVLNAGYHVHYCGIFVKVQC